MGEGEWGAYSRGGGAALILNFGRLEGRLFEWGAYSRGGRLFERGRLFEDLRYNRGCHSDCVNIYAGLIHMQRRNLVLGTCGGTSLKRDFKMSSLFAFEETPRISLSRKLVPFRIWSVYAGISRLALVTWRYFDYWLAHHFYVAVIGHWTTMVCVLEYSAKKPLLELELGYKTILCKY